MDYSSLRETLRTPQWSEAQDRVSDWACPADIVFNPTAIAAAAGLPSLCTPRPSMSSALGAPCPGTSANTARPQILLEPYTYISANPGKEVRTKLIDAFNAWLDVPDTDLEVIRRIVRMLHNASLL
jgi:hypothetical protein